MENNESKPGIGKILMIAIPVALVLLSVAAIIIIIIPKYRITSVKTYVGPTPTSAAQGGMMQVVNPYTYYETADAFKENLGLTLDAPEGCEADKYIIIGGQIADVRFTSNGHDYTLRAAKTDEDISGIMGTLKDTEKLTSKNALLSVIGTEEESYVKITWTEDEVQYSLANTDGATAEDVKAVFEKIK